MATAFDWLHDLSMSHEYRSLVSAYKLVPPETWARYDLFDIEGLQEQIILEAASKKLLKRWRSKRPNLIGKRKNANKAKNSSNPS